MKHKQVTLIQNNPTIAAEWHPTKNEPLSPTTISYASNRMVWWQCQQGHEWKARVFSRTLNQSRCPICIKEKQISPHLNPRKTQTKPIDPEKALSVRFPSLINEWHPTKNHPLSPNDVTFGSTLVVWWQCQRGHEWVAPVNRRTSKQSGCPFCAGKKIQIGFNDLATMYPSIANEWHPIKNAPLSPTEVTHASNKRVWWQCRQGHEWQVKVSSRTTSLSQCPHCYKEQLKRK